MAVKNDPQNYCRLCGHEKEHLTCIFEKEDLNENIDRYLGIQIFEEDSHSHEICYACENEISRIVKYITSSRRLQRELHKIPKNGRPKMIADDIKLEDPPLQIIETKIEIDPCLSADQHSGVSDHQNSTEFTLAVPQPPPADNGEPNSSIIIKTDRNSNEMLELRALGKNIETKMEVDPHSADLYSNVRNSTNDVIFTLNVPELPPTDNGKPNSSISITTGPNTNQSSELRALGRDNLKQLGKKLYCTYGERVMQEIHLKLTFSEIENDLNCFRKSLRMDPALPEKNMDHKIPAVLVKPLQVTFNTDSDLTSPTNTSNGFTTASEVSTKFLTCHLCPFETTQKFRLTQHHKEVHEKPFPCDECDRRFGKESKLLLHKKTEHTDLSPPITCSLCSTSFTQRYHYKQHLKTHSNNDSSWFCDYCKESFSHQHKLDVHMARFHKKKSVKCSRCTYVAAHKYQIKQHIREVHLKPIICAECGKRESKKCRMEAHIRSKHLEKTMYECESCFTKYTSKKWFEAHKKKGCPGALPLPNQALINVRRLT